MRLQDFRVAIGGLEIIRGIGLRLDRGEAVGMVGESGSGKSVTWLAALGLLSAAQAYGSATFAGREMVGASERELAAIRGGKIGLIFQDPVSALNPVRRVGMQIAEMLRLHQQLTGAAAQAEARRLFDQVGIPDARRRLARYPHEFSGGQSQRVMIAMALAGKPDLLVADEPTTALDTTVQAQILDLLDGLRHETGMALLLISHDLNVVADLTERIVVMYAGRIVEEVPSARLFSAAAHPYTRGLLAAVPPLFGPRGRLTAIPGQVPEPWNLPPGCAFAPRCPLVLPVCDAAVPSPRPAGPGHRAACVRVAPAPASARA